MMKSKKHFQVYSTTIQLVLLSALLIIIGTVVAYSATYAKYQDQQEKTANSDVFQTMKLETLDGETFTSKDFASAKINFINVWGTTCPACIHEMPDLETLSQEYKGDLQMIGMLTDVRNKDGEIDKKTYEDAVKIVKDTGVTYPQLIMDNEVRQFVLTNIAGTPTTYIVDPEGKILDSITGARSYEEWKDRVENYIKEGQ